MVGHVIEQFVGHGSRPRSGPASVAGVRFDGSGSLRAGPGPARHPPLGPDGNARPREWRPWHHDPRPIRIIQVDAFTDTPFRGNPAAVALLDEPRHDAFLQAVALEMNLSETAFPLPRRRTPLARLPTTRWRPMACGAGASRSITASPPG
ncbi:MAG: PhzF family phenazine biosynthesis protein [Acidimicrobiales bacterium]